MSNIIYKIIRKLSMIILYHVFRDKSKYLSWFGLFAVGYKLNLKNPKTFNEKINWYKLNYRNPLMIKATDKLLVKEYLKEKGLESIIVPTIKVFDTLDQIKYESLPDKFVMKTNSDSGGVCNKLTKDSYIKGMAKINKCLMNDFSKYVVEWNYKDINKKIFIESLIETSNQKPPIDYKVFCFNGEPKFLYIATDRPKSTKFDFYDINWNRIHVKNHYPNSLINHEKPKNFDKTIEICRVLSKDFPHVRVDLYNEDDKIYFGELTFFHFSGLQPFNPRIWDYKFGEYFTFDFKD